MATFDKHKNLVITTITVAPTTPTAGTAPQVSTTDAAILNDGTILVPPYNATVLPPNVQPTAANAEIVRVTAVNTSTGVLTISRAQESTTAVSIGVGYKLIASITAKTITDIETALNNMGTTTVKQNINPTGAIDGSNTSYTVPDNYAANTLEVYLNGQHLYPGSGVDYVEVTNGFTMQYAPATGDVLRVNYLLSNTAFIQGSNSQIVNETPSGTVNGTTTLFTVLQGKYVANTLEVTINGITQARGTDYTETSPGSGTFTFASAPLTGKVVRVNYQFSTGASGNADTVDGFHASSTATASNILPLDGSAHFPVSVLQNPYKFSAYAGGTTALGVTAFTKVAFNTKEYDTGTNYDATTNNRFTAPVAGYYQFSANVELTAGAAGETYVISLYKNGTEVKRGTKTITGASGTVDLEVAPPPLLLAANDYIEVWVYNGTSGGKTVSSGQQLTYFGGYLVCVA